MAAIAASSARPRESSWRVPTSTSSSALTVASISVQAGVEAGRSEPRNGQRNSSSPGSEMSATGRLRALMPAAPAARAR